MLKVYASNTHTSNRKQFCFVIKKNAFFFVLFEEWKKSQIKMRAFNLFHRRFSKGFMEISSAPCGLIKSSFVLTVGSKKKKIKFSIVIVSRLLFILN